MYIYIYIMNQPPRLWLGCVSTGRCQIPYGHRGRAVTALVLANAAVADATAVAALARARTKVAKNEREDAAFQMMMLSQRLHTFM